MERKKIILISVLIAMIIIVGSVTAYLFFYTKTCTTEKCFLQAQRECSRASYTVSNEGNVWQYKVLNSLSFSQNLCTIKVKNLQIASEDPLAMKVQGKGMRCRVPRELAGTYVRMESKLEYCSGPLKESLQDLLIDQLYKYIVQNIGEITEELRK